MISICKHCGRPYSVRHRGELAHYCTYMCMVQDRQAFQEQETGEILQALYRLYVGVDIMRCKICGGEVPRGRKLYCSRACMELGNRKNNQEKRDDEQRKIDERIKRAEDKGRLLAMINANARAAGMTYGQYMARRYQHAGEG